jgi:hypothetical protein
MLAFIYVASASLAPLSLAVDKIEPNSRYASVLKLLIVLVSGAAIAGRLMP